LLKKVIIQQTMFKAISEKDFTVIEYVCQMLLGRWEALTLSGGHIVGMQDPTLESHQPLRPSQIADLRLAASKMTGPTRRAFQAEMALKYCGGNPLLAESIFGWGRHTVEVGLAERRTGLLCLGAQSAFSGRKRWEDTQPEAAAALYRLAEAQAQQDPTFRTTLAYTRLTAKAALAALRAQGYGTDQLPSPSTMAEVLNRMGFRLRKVVKAKPQKKIAETTLFSRILKKRPSGDLGPRQTREHRL
jgi:Rhodopirellula transposase DDE domain